MIKNIIIYMLIRFKLHIVTRMTRRDFMIDALSIDYHNPWVDTVY